MLISLKEYAKRNAEGQTVLEPLLQTIQLLLNGIADDPVKGDEFDLAQFRTEIQQLETSVQQASTPRDILKAAVLLYEAHKNYNQRTEKYLSSQKHELQSMVKMLIAAISNVATNANRSADYLHTLGRRLEKAADIHDYRIMRQRLGACLASVDSEERSQRQEISRQKLELTRQLQRVREYCPPERASRQGGGGRIEAEETLSAAIESGRHGFCTVIVIQRLHTINSEYGYSIGDEVLTEFRNQVEKLLSPGDRLLRWNGPAFLLLMERSGELHRVEAEVSRILASRIAVEVEFKTRPILLLVSAIHSIFPTSTTTIQEARGKIDAFIASQIPTTGVSASPEP